MLARIGSAIERFNQSPLTDYREDVAACLRVRILRRFLAPEVSHYK